MKIFVEKIIFKNRAPFEDLELDFAENEIAVLTAINGSGKTTILSHIVDAWYEIAKRIFPLEFKDKELLYYRISSKLFNLNFDKPSIVYIRFRVDGMILDHIDIINKCSEAQYDNSIKLDDKIPFHNFENEMDNRVGFKFFHTKVKDSEVDNIFNTNLVTYFPSYRFEIPGYLNEPYKINLEFKKYSDFNGYMRNPIEVRAGLPKILNWIMDVILDLKLYNSQDDADLGNNLNLVITKILSSKKIGNLHLGLGKRGYGSTRLRIISDENQNEIYPSLHNLSSGEVSLFCLFVELLRQADNYNQNITFDKITGIVLIDEIDKHLHIKLQKEVLPLLLGLFPNVQFITSSHSPFFSLGLVEQNPQRAKIIDLDNFGIVKDPTELTQFNEVYNIIFKENERFKEKFNEIKNELNNSSLPLIITEGKTDLIHLRKAKNVLEFKDIEFSLVDDMGDIKLEQLLKSLSFTKQSRIIIGVFDRDNDKIVKNIEVNNNDFFNFKNNVFGMCIPLVNENIYCEKISIEHYYPMEVLLKKDQYNRRLFLGSEFYENGNSQDGMFQTKISNIQNKVKVNGIIDEKVYESSDLEQKNSIALSKYQFAQRIDCDESFLNGYKFSEFNLIFERIQKIIDFAKKHNE